ncbi:uncharacterized protein LOC112046701 isoform X2 [Bicyclus anynana]|nr:uncharacterized protein LOC112046701 isoform X2 [Bicyclus anynana]
MIQSVHSKACLWNKYDLAYRDKSARDRAWTEVYRDVFPGYDELKEKMRARVGQQISKKWFNCRDAYVKSMKEAQRGKRPYIYTNILRFLDPVLSDKGSDNQVVFLDEQLFDDDNESWHPTSFVDMDEPPNKKAKLETPSKDYLEATDPDNESLVSILARLLHKEDDEDRAFFTSLVPSVKSLTDNAKLEFKIQVMKLLKEIKIKDKEGGFVKLRGKESD